MSFDWFDTVSAVMEVKLPSFEIQGTGDFICPGCGFEAEPFEFTLFFKTEGALHIKGKCNGFKCYVCDCSYIPVDSQAEFIRICRRKLRPYTPVRSH